MSSLILASGSAIRRTLLENAGLTFMTETADLDERAVEAPLLEADLCPADIGLVLAEAKAHDVSARYPDAIVIGADQMLDFNGKRLTKPETMDEARRQLLAFRGKTHVLHSAVVLVKNGETLWRHVSPAHMHIRDFSPEFLGNYLSEAGENILKSVGAYQLEGAGIHLFEKIEGDYFTVLGLPLLPLLDELRRHDIGLGLGTKV